MMKLDRSAVSVSAITVVIIGFLAVAGCESSGGGGSSSGSLAISPTSVSIGALVSTNVIFTASGGTPPYNWDVDDPALGSVAGADDTAIYTSAAASGQNFVTLSDAASNSVAATVDQIL
ncbi:MAG: hypothetical protein QGI24_03315 [Kiritimatiellia bacterium]|jgi:hypothetical protein|nr:hypothetical protein [Kiritimatiellia bacterium]MDP6847792.1 hypothetical protein [Kiritimatiellia bacterium]